MKNCFVSHRYKSRNSFLWFIRDRLDACFWRDEYSKEGCAKLFVRRHIVGSVHTETSWNIYAGFCLLSSCVQTARGPPIVSIRTPELSHNTTSALSNLCLVSFYLRRIHPRICNYGGTSEVTRKMDESLSRSPFMLMQTRRAHILKIFEKKFSFDWKKPFLFFFLD